MIRSKLKKVLKTIGVFDTLNSVRFNWKYGKVDTYRLLYRGLDIQYSSADMYSKKWFYPRYDHGRMHEPSIINILLKELKANDNFIDVGANLGFFTCIGGALCKNGRVFAIEMDPKCIPMIEKNVQLNKLDNVTIINAAATDQKGFEQIPNLESPNPRLMIVSSSSTEDVLTVPSICLDDLSREFDVTPSLLKIDAEGAELKVLNGMSTILKNPDVRLLVEIHCEKLKYFGSDYPEVLNMLHENGFKIREIVSHRKNELLLRDLEPNSTLGGNVMVFATKK